MKSAHHTTARALGLAEKQCPIDDSVAIMILKVMAMVELATPTVLVGPDGSGSFSSLVGANDSKAKSVMISLGVIKILTVRERPAKRRRAILGANQYVDIRK
jgi:hypothetical protein